MSETGTIYIGITNSIVPSNTMTNYNSIFIIYNPNNINLWDHNHKSLSEVSDWTPSISYFTSFARSIECLVSFRTLAPNRSKNSVLDHLWSKQSSLSQHLMCKFSSSDSALGLYTSLSLGSFARIFFRFLLFSYYVFRRKIGFAGFFSFLSESFAFFLFLTLSLVKLGSGTSFEFLLLGFGLGVIWT